jgi:hypothetical protein
MADVLEAERQRREALWDLLHRETGPQRVSPHRLRELRIYGGAQGIWVDKVRTGHLTPNGTGVTVGLLHTGTAYADDLDDTGVLYHYPHTRRPPGRDLAEIAATKAAGRLGMPVFVITYPSPKAPLRSVHFSWIEESNDPARIFLVTFGPTRPAPEALTAEEDAPFTLVEPQLRTRGTELLRPGQHRFKFKVLERYGPACAVCDLDVVAVLDAAHLRPKREHGVDDARNGLVLCAVHHRAFDAGLFAFEPGTLTLHYRPQGPDATTLRISRRDLQHLTQKPHADAVRWLWLAWTRQQPATVQAG